MNQNETHNSNIILYKYAGHANQRWRIDLDVIGNYTFSSLYENRVLEVATTHTGGQIAQATTNRTGEVNQRWRIFNVNDVSNGLF